MQNNFRWKLTSKTAQHMTTAFVLLKQSAHLSPRIRAPRAGYAVRVLKAKPRAVVRISEQTAATFSAISDPANANRFSVDAALAAFADVDA